MNVKLNVSYTQKNNLLNERDLIVAPIIHLIKSSKLGLF